VDLRKFFDTVDHRQMRELLSRRVQAGVLTRLIGIMIGVENYACAERQTFLSRAMEAVQGACR